MTVYDILFSRTTRKQSIFNGVFLAIASVLRRLNSNYDDYDIRLHMCELTADEARAEIRGDIANHDKRTREALAWSEMWG